MKVRCNDCMSIFDEKYIEIDPVNDKECCPVCGKIGCLMDIEEETRNYAQFRSVLENNISITELVNFDEFNENTFDIIAHNIVKELLTDKRCPRCDAPLYCSDLPQYDYVCVECEENFYECEVK